MELQFDAEGVPFVLWGEHKIKVERSPVTDPKCLEKAEKELRETPDNVKKGLSELRQLLQGENKLQVPVDNDEFLMKFLRPSKFYAESAFKKIQAYYKFRLQHEDYCKDLMPSAVRLAFDHSTISLLSPRDQHGRRIIVVEAGELWKYREVPLKEAFRGMQLCLEAAMTEPATQVHGVIFIVDTKGLSFSQIMQLTPMFVNMVVEWIQDCIPLRLKAFHVVRQPYIFNMLFAIFKPLLCEKLRSRIFLHGSNKQSLLKHVDPVALRKRHGGLLPEPEVPGPVLWKMLHYYEDSFKLANSYGYSTKNNT